MSSKPKLPRCGLPPDWPREVRLQMAGWLRHKLNDLDTTKKRLQEALKLGELEWLRKNLDYIEHARGAVKWLLYAVERGHKGRLAANEGSTDGTSGHATEGEQCPSSSGSGTGADGTGNH